MSAIQTQLVELRQALELALNDSDWDAVGPLDDQCRTVVEQVAQASPSPELREALRGLLELYPRLIAATTQVRDALGVELTQARRQAGASKVYQLFSSQLA